MYQAKELETHDLGGIYFSAYNSPEQIIRNSIIDPVLAKSLIPDLGAMRNKVYSVSLSSIYNKVFE
jgi:hypothetical protein